jgi:hypothetical protein
MLTRREFGAVAAGAIAGAFAGTRAVAGETRIGGVSVGAISYCFRSIPRPAAGDYMDTLIDAFRQTGIGLCELESARVEPEPPAPQGSTPKQRREPAVRTGRHADRRRVAAAQVGAAPHRCGDRIRVHGSGVGDRRSQEMQVVHRAGPGAIMRSTGDDDRRLVEAAAQVVSGFSRTEYSPGSAGRRSVRL